MLQSAWLFVGFVALCATAVAVSTKTRAASLYGNDDGVAIFSGIAGVISWGIWTYGTLEVTVVGDAVTYTFSMPSLTFFGLMMAVIPAFIALTGPAEIVSRYRNADARDI